MGSGTGRMRKASQWINQWAINLVLEELGRSLTVFDTKRSLDDTARADDGTARNTRETRLSKVSKVSRIWYWTGVFYVSTSKHAPPRPEP